MTRIYDTYRHNGDRCWLWRLVGAFGVLLAGLAYGLLAGGHVFWD